MVLSILFAIAAVAAAVALAIHVRRHGLALGAADNRAATLEADLGHAREDQAQQLLRAETAERERHEQQARADSLASEVQVAALALAEAISARGNATAELEQLRAERRAAADAATLWALELARVERRWHTSVAPGIDLTSPLSTSDAADQPRLALEIIVAALREETGTRFDIDWRINGALPVPATLVTVRTADEMLAAAALACETGHLVAAQEHNTIVLAIEAFDLGGVPVALAPFTFASAIDTADTARAFTIDGAIARISMDPAGELAT